MTCQMVTTLLMNYTNIDAFCFLIFVWINLKSVSLKKITKLGSVYITNRRSDKLVTICQINTLRSLGPKLGKTTIMNLMDTAARK